MVPAGYTEEEIERAAMALVPFYYEGFEDQRCVPGTRTWLYPPGAPNDRARAAARAALSTLPTREATLWEVAAWHQTQAKEARRIIRETAGEVSMAHAAAAATHSSSAAAILSLIPQPAQPSREAPGLKCAIDIANERIAAIRHFGGDSGPAEMVRNRLIDALALADKPEPGETT